jgi:RNA-splicing ligase RtcB
MKDGSIIGIGKGNADWNESCSHGAGRVMSRSEAKANLSLEEFQETMKGIYSTTVSIDTIDESPMAYKNACDILDLISETIDVEKIITPVYNFKASE